jgi:hypothetical protein
VIAPEAAKPAVKAYKMPYTHTHTLILNVIVDWSCSCKVDVPNSVICLNRTTIFEWYVIRCDFKNEH